MLLSSTVDCRKQKNITLILAEKGLNRLCNYCACGGYKGFVTNCYSGMELNNHKLLII